MITISHLHLVFNKRQFSTIYSRIDQIASDLLLWLCLGSGTAVDFEEDDRPGEGVEDSLADEGDVPDEDGGVEEAVISGHHHDTGQPGEGGVVFP